VLQVLEVTGGGGFEAPVRAMYFRAFMPPVKPSGPASNIRQTTYRSETPANWLAVN
jgi:hypothetical protein